MGGVNQKSVTLGRSCVLLEYHQPNGNGNDEAHSVCFPGLLWDPIGRSMGTGKHSKRDERAVQAGGNAS